MTSPVKLEWVKNVTGGNLNPEQLTSEALPRMYVVLSVDIIVSRVCVCEREPSLVSA